MKIWPSWPLKSDTLVVHQICQMKLSNRTLSEQKKNLDSCLECSTLNNATLWNNQCTPHGFDNVDWTNSQLSQQTWNNYKPRKCICVVKAKMFLGVVKMTEHFAQKTKMSKHDKTRLFFFGSAKFTKHGINKTLYNRQIDYTVKAILLFLTLIIIWN